MLLLTCHYIHISNYFCLERDSILPMQCQYLGYCCGQLDRKIYSFFFLIYFYPLLPMCMVMTQLKKLN